jgi:Fe2+ transport system protein FeoA
MTLTQLGIGKTATIVAIEGGRNLRQKLLLRGLFEGMVVRLVSNPDSGPVVVEVERSIVAIGRGMVKKFK